MGRVKKTSWIKEDFVAVYRKLLKDPVFRGLRNSSMIAYIYLRSKFNTRTLGEVTLTYSEMKDIMCSATYWRALTELEEKGFIEKVQPGGLKGCGGVPTTFKFKGEHSHFYYKGMKV